MSNLAILTYHSLDDSGSVISTAPGTFRRQIAALLGQGISIVPLAELLELRRQSNSRPAVALTFDDGFTNFLAEAFPVLQQHGLPATVFVVSGYCGRTNDWPSQPAGFGGRPLLDWPEIRELHSAGIEFGAHSINHPDLTCLSLEKARAEILDSKKQIEEALQQPVTSFAYPYGAESNALREIVAEHFTAGCSTRLGYLAGRSAAESVERIDVHYLRRSTLYGRLFGPSTRNYLALRGLLRRWSHGTQPSS